MIIESVSVNNSNEVIICQAKDLTIAKNVANGELLHDGVLVCRASDEFVFRIANCMPVRIRVAERSLVIS